MPFSLYFFENTTITIMFLKDSNLKIFSQRMNECLNDEGVCRTSPATPGQLKTATKTYCCTVAHGKSWEVKREMTFSILRYSLATALSWPDPDGHHHVMGVRDTLHCTVLHCTKMHCTASYYNTLHCTALYYSALHCNALYYDTLHCTALHCTPMHWTALHFNVL